MPLSSRSLQPETCAEQAFVSSKALLSVCLSTYEGPSLLGGNEAATLGGTYSDAPRLTIGRKQSGSTQDAASALPRAESTALPAPKIGKTLSIELCRSVSPSFGWRFLAPIVADQPHSRRGSRMQPACTIRCSSFTFLLFHQLLLGGTCCLFVLPFPFECNSRLAERGESEGEP